MEECQNTNCDITKKIYISPYKNSYMAIHINIGNTIVLHNCEYNDFTKYKIDKIDIGYYLPYNYCIQIGIPHDNIEHSQLFNIYHCTIDPIYKTKFNSNCWISFINYKYDNNNFDLFYASSYNKFINYHLITRSPCDVSNNDEIYELWNSNGTLNVMCKIIR